MPNRDECTVGHWCSDLNSPSLQPAGDFQSIQLRSDWMVTALLCSLRRRIPVTSSLGTEMLDSVGHCTEVSSQSWKSLLERNLLLSQDYCDIVDIYLVR